MPTYQQLSCAKQLLRISLCNSCFSLCFVISPSGVVGRLYRLLCSVVSHATEQRCVCYSHECYRAACATEQTCGVGSVVWRCCRLLFSLVSSVLRVCVRPYCALRSFRDDDVDDVECPSVAILAQETSVKFSPQAPNTAYCVPSEIMAESCYRAPWKQR